MHVDSMSIDLGVPLNAKLMLQLQVQGHSSKLLLVQVHFQDNVSLL